eukprot:CAMPEP_0119333562 /NCGR_PEP_ID=MMETSP1333-20130426/85430_1 /TAXON_ID=418940 /ORGANISM="Scyphosphaera apsteinii, Strain RCC1455" /LENGTH=234 /DNA_ID=CAMNT_0007343659 /DNA_START=163 /DNA_END=867 /DNA_ORIENTATION=-
MGVRELTNSSFYDTVMHGRWLILWHSPSCGVCRAFSPVWQQLSEKVDRIDSDTKLAMVDASIETALAQRHDIVGFPTLILMQSGQMLEYEGDRTLSGLYEFVQSGGDWENSVRAPGRPTLLEPLRSLPSAVADVYAFASSSSNRLLAQILLLAVAFAAGTRIGSGWFSYASFITVVCPAGVQPGQPFPVTLPSRFWWRPPRVLMVAAPAGISEGQTFFVPLRLSTQKLVKTKVG